MEPSSQALVQTPESDTPAAQRKHLPVPLQRSDLFVSQVPPPAHTPTKSLGEQIVKQGEVVANLYSETWCRQLSDLRGHAGGMWT